MKNTVCAIITLINPKLIHKVSTTISSVHSGTKKSLLNNYNSISEEHILKNAHIRWKDKNFDFSTDIPANHDYNIEELDFSDEDDKKIIFERIKSHMIGVRLLKHFTQTSIDQQLTSKKFRWMDSDGTIVYDGPTILYQILNINRRLENVLLK